MPMKPGRGDSLDAPLKGAPLFDLPKGRCLRDAAIVKVMRQDPDWLDNARRVAQSIARERGSVTADDLREFLPEPPHHNLMGAVFAGSEWALVGYEQSRRPKAHARLLRRWRLA